jgi:hypothetical protein
LEIASINYAASGFARSQCRPPKGKTTKRNSPASVMPSAAFLFKPADVNFSMDNSMVA